jgi:ATP-dependent Clp protease adapter protein ClpS
MKKENKKPNMLKALKIKVMTLNDDNTMKKLENNFANQLNDYLIKKNKQNYFKV